MDQVRASIHEALRREESRLDEQAQLFMRMGFVPDELMVLIDRRDGRHETSVVPKLIAST